MWKFSSGVSGGFLPTPLEVFFLPPAPPNRHVADKFSFLLLQVTQLGIRHSGILSCDANDALIPVLDGHSDESLLLK